MDIRLFVASRPAIWLCTHSESLTTDTLRDGIASWRKATVDQPAAGKACGYLRITCKAYFRGNSLALGFLCC